MIYKEATKDNKKLVIYYDEDPESPRDWGNLGTMVCWHRRYSLGDEQPNMTMKDWARALVNIEDEDENSAEWVEIHKQYIILPLYLYDHSGITIKTSPFSCGWDSVQVGWIYCKKGAEGLTDEEIRSYLISEVELYDQYLRGNVYGYACRTLIECGECGHVREEDGNSCWGFYGDDFNQNGLNDSVPEEFKFLLEEL